jgi:protein TonB
MELMSLNSPNPKKRPRSFVKIASVAFHVILILALTYQFTGVGKLTKPPAPRVLTAFAPKQSAAPPQPRKPKIKIIKPKEEPKLAMKTPPPPPPPSVAGDPTGEKDVSVAFALVYPAPDPNLAVLPHGTKGDVLVSITIDETGKVIDGHVDQGLGHGVDEAVLATVMTWSFDPATRADKPIASVQQLLFHFERA